MPRISTFEPFANSNFSAYFAGVVLSNIGTWFQNLALSLVILQATGSVQALSGVTVAQFLPILVLGILAGRLADRIRPRTIILAGSLISMVIVGALAVVVGSPTLNLAAIYALIAGLGCVNAFERVAAQAIVFELVGAPKLASAAALSTIALAAARSVGPALAGLLFQAAGPVWCLVVNAGAYLLAVVCNLCIRPSKLYARVPAERSDPDQRTPAWRLPGVPMLLIVNSCVALLCFNLIVVLTAMTTLTFEGDASVLGVVHMLNAIGAIIGGVLASRHQSVSLKSLIGACAALGTVLLMVGLAPTIAVFIAVGPLLGGGVGYYQGVMNAVAQSSVPPPMIGRMMAMMTMGHYGMMPIGAIIIGAVIDASSARVSLTVGAGTAFVCAISVGIFIAIRRRPKYRN